MKFNPNNYKGKYDAMHCKTQAELNDFIKYLKAHGYADMAPLHNSDCYYGKNVYYFNVPYHWSSITHANDEGYTVLEWSDFMNGAFTKADLKTGDIIKQRDGLVGIVNADLDIAITRGGWLDLSKYNDDLTSKLTDYGFDIMAVRRPIEKHDCQFNAFEYKWGTLIYDRERDTVEEMTLAEVCKLLGKNIKIIK